MEKKPRKNRRERETEHNKSAFESFMNIPRNEWMKNIGTCTSYMTNILFSNYNHAKQFIA